MRRWPAKTHSQPAPTPPAAALGRFLRDLARLDKDAPRNAIDELLGDVGPAECLGVGSVAEGRWVVFYLTGERRDLIVATWPLPPTNTTSRIAAARVMNNWTRADVDQRLVRR